MAWRNARASLVLAEEIKARWPHHDTASDGTIGDAAHQSRDSDHNPWVIDADGYGVVRARDIDEDLDGATADTGPDASWLAEHLRALGAAGDVRLANYGYVIYEGRIAGGNPARGPGRWQWRPYTGTNAHRKHVHVSLSRDADGYDSTAPWGIHPTSEEDLDMSTEELAAMLADPKGPLRELYTEVGEIHREVTRSIDGKDPRSGKRTLRHIAASILNKGGG